MFSGVRATRGGGAASSARRGVVAAIYLLAAPGCGARSEIPSEDPTAGATDQTPEPTPSAAPTTAGNDAPNDDWLFEPVALPPCNLGPEQRQSTSCPYRADGRCYETQNEGCACICDGSRETTCVGRFVSDNSVQLSCE